MMKKILKVLTIIFIVILVTASGGILYFNSKFPAEIPLESIKIDLTPERIQRGYYLANHVSMCVDCHSSRDWRYYSGPIIEETLGKGGEMFNEEIANVPGTIYSKNITPTGVGTYTDGELLRAITCGINKDGVALFPLMPYVHYREMAREDIYSIIAYLRTMKPIANEIPERSLNFPVNFLVKQTPSPAAMVDAIPSKGDTLAYGKYMTNAAACLDCHTQMDKGKFLPGMEFAGGFRFQLPDGNYVYSANITSDVETGIGALSRESFIAKFKAFSGQGSRIPVKANEKNTIMPWTRLSGMTEDDLGAIYDYLRTMPAVKNKVETWVAKK